MEHELFRHLELELFVQRSQVEQASAFVTDVLRTADDPALPASEALLETLTAQGRIEDWERLRGSYTHHYPICFRRILPDDTLISMASAEGRPAEDWYAISLITYREPRDPFYQVAGFLADTMAGLFGARIHWGKWFPHDKRHVEERYPALPAFRAICRRLDPRGVFRNRFIREKLGD